MIDRLYDEHEYDIDREKINEIIDVVNTLLDGREALVRALVDLHAEVEMAESIGVCLPDRAASLNAGKLLATLAHEPD